MKKYDYLIVGCGLFGSVFAYEMNKIGKKCLVIDKRSHIGGNIYTQIIEGIPIHKYGAHIFHTSDESIWKYINKFAHFNRYTNSPIAKYKDKVYNLPFNMNTFSKMWGITTPKEAKEIIKKQILAANIETPKNLEEQAISIVGKDIYEILIKGYTEKQWGRRANDLPAFIIKRLPVRFTYDNNYFNDKYQGIPEGGYTGIIEKMLNGIEVRLNTNFFDKREEFKKISNKILFTGMIDEYFKYRYGHLEYRSLSFETEILNEENYQGNAVVNYTEFEIPFTRIIEHKHFEFMCQNEDKKTNKTIITKEYPSSWSPGVEPYYPVNDEKNNNIFQKYALLANSEKNVIFGGRLGMYRYLDMDEIIYEALNCVEDEKKL